MDAVRPALQAFTGYATRQPPAGAGVLGDGPLIGGLCPAPWMLYASTCTAPDEFA